MTCSRSLGGTNRSHPGVSQPMSRSSVERWRRDLPPEAGQLFRGEADELLVELGYAEDDRWIEEDVFAPSQRHVQAD